MIDELKSEVEKTFSRKIVNRGDCEALAHDVYVKTGAVLSYNTLRRIYGLAENRNARESTLNQLAVYCGFHSYKDFCQRFSEVDIWPSWESLYVILSRNDTTSLLELLRFRRRRNEQFTLSFTIIVRELIYRKDLKALLAIFRDEEFNFNKLPYDEVAQIGVLIGMVFRNFSDFELEKQLLRESNFRDIVFKIFVDYKSLNGKYGKWVHFLYKLEKIDKESRLFIHCIELWRRYLVNEPFNKDLKQKIPTLSTGQHPILFGRIFGLKVIFAENQKQKKVLLQKMQKRLNAQPQFANELLFEPSLQCLVTRDVVLMEFLMANQNIVNDIKYWYHISQVAVHKVFQVSVAIHAKQYTKAKNILSQIPFHYIRHGYREFVELYSTFFNFHIAKQFNAKNQQELWAEHLKIRNSLNYAILNKAYFENYFSN